MKAHWKEMAEKFKVGDLVIIPERLSASGKPPGKKCECFFCGQNSHRVGVLTEIDVDVDDNPYFVTQFDVGEWCFYPPDVEAGDVEVLSESR